MGPSPMTLLWTPEAEGKHGAAILLEASGVGKMPGPWRVHPCSWILPWVVAPGRGIFSSSVDTLLGHQGRAPSLLNAVDRTVRQRRAPLSSYPARFFFPGLMDISFVVIVLLYRAWTQGFTLARQALYHLRHSASSAPNIYKWEKLGLKRTLGC
jgi:hypothetical protein